MYLLCLLQYFQLSPSLPVDPITMFLFDTAYKADMPAIHSLSLCLHDNIISLLVLRVTCARYRILG